MPAEFIVFIFGIWSLPEGFVEFKHGIWPMHNVDYVISPRTGREIPDANHELFEGEAHEFIEGDILTVVKDGEYHTYIFK